MKRINLILFIGFISSISMNHINAQNMNALDNKQQKIVTIAANTAVGNLDALKTELHAGLEAGLTVSQIKEILIQMYAYTGFPRSLQGINTFMSVIKEREANGIMDNVGREASPITDTRDKYIRGKEILQSLTGIEERTLSGANAFTPAIDVFLKEHLFADIFERDVLTHQERELATISALAAMKGVEPMLQSHLNMGMNVGLSENQLHQLVSIIGTMDEEQEQISNSILNNVINNRK